MDVKILMNDFDGSKLDDCDQKRGQIMTFDQNEKSKDTGPIFFPSILPSDSEDALSRIIERSHEISYNIDHKKLPEKYSDGRSSIDVNEEYEKLKKEVITLLRIEIDKI